MAKKSTPKKRRVTVHPKLFAVYNRGLKQPFLRLKKRAQNFLKRRPHRSFRRTRARDMPKLAPLPAIYFLLPKCSVLCGATNVHL